MTTLQEESTSNSETSSDEDISVIDCTCMKIPLGNCPQCPVYILESFEGASTIKFNETEVILAKINEYSGRRGKRVAYLKMNYSRQLPLSQPKKIYASRRFQLIEKLGERSLTPCIRQIICESYTFVTVKNTMHDKSNVTINKGDILGMCQNMTYKSIKQLIGTPFYNKVLNDPLKFRTNIYSDSPYFMTPNEIWQIKATLKEDIPKDKNMLVEFICPKYGLKFESGFKCLQFDEAKDKIYVQVKVKNISSKPIYLKAGQEFGMIQNMMCSRYCEKIISKNNEDLKRQKYKGNSYNQDSRLKRKGSNEENYADDSRKRRRSSGNTKVKKLLDSHRAKDPKHDNQNVERKSSMDTEKQNKGQKCSKVFELKSSEGTRPQRPNAGEEKQRHLLTIETQTNQSVENKKTRERSSSSVLPTEEKNPSKQTKETTTKTILTHAAIDISKEKQLKTKGSPNDNSQQIKKLRISNSISDSETLNDLTGLKTNFSNMDGQMIEPKSLSKSPSPKGEGSSIDRSQYITKNYEEPVTDKSKANVSKNCVIQIISTDGNITDRESSADTFDLDLGEDLQTGSVEHIEKMLESVKTKINEHCDAIKSKTKESSEEKLSKKMKHSHDKSNQRQREGKMYDLISKENIDIPEETSRVSLMCEVPVIEFKANLNLFSIKIIDVSDIFNHGFEVQKDICPILDDNCTRLFLHGVSKQPISLRKGDKVGTCEVVEDFNLDEKMMMSTDYKLRTKHECSIESYNSTDVDCEFDLYDNPYIHQEYFTRSLPGLKTLKVMKSRQIACYYMASNKGNLTVRVQNTSYGTVNMTAGYVVGEAVKISSKGINEGRERKGD